MTLARRLTTERLMLGILFILLFVIAVRVPVDTDTWWHLRSGNYILNEGKIPQTDPFSHTKNGEAWIDHSWGGQVIMTLAYRLTGGSGNIDDSGVIGLALYTAILGTAGMLCVYRMCEGSIYSKAFVMVFGAASAAVFWSPRPQMLSFFLSAAVLYILHLYKREALDRLWLIPVMMIFWVNLHGGFAIGFILLILFIIGEIIGNLLNPADPDAIGWRGVQKLTLITVVSLAALAINPYGIRMIWYPFDTAGLQTLNVFIQEWQSPDFKLPQTWAFVILLLSTFGFALLTNNRPAWSDISLVLGTLLLSLWAGRNIATFAVVTTPVLSRLVDHFLTERGWQIRPTRKMTTPKALINVALLTLIALSGLLKVVADLTPRNVQDIQADLMPINAIAYLQENPPQGNLFNSYNWGGLLMFVLPDHPVFVDGRTDLYGDDFLKEYFHAYLGGSKWQEPLDKYHVQTVILEKETALSTLLREEEGWEIVYEDKQAVIFVHE